MLQLHSPIQPRPHSKRSNACKVGMRNKESQRSMPRYYGIQQNIPVLLYFESQRGYRCKFENQSFADALLLQLDISSRHLLLES